MSQGATNFDGAKTFGSNQVEGKATWQDVRVRPLGLGDVQPTLDFLYRNTRDSALIRSIDFSKWPAESDYRRVLTDAVHSPAVMPSVAIEFKGRTIGVHFLNNQADSSADFQAYLWQDNGKGVFRISWFKACQYFFANFALETVFFRVPKDNPMSLSAVRKLPLNLVGEEDIPYPGIKPGTRARVYSLSRSEFETMNSMTQKSDEEEDDEESDL